MQVKKILVTQRRKKYLQRLINHFLISINARTSFYNNLKVVCYFLIAQFFNVVLVSLQRFIQRDNVIGCKEHSSSSRFCNLVASLSYLTTLTWKTRRERSSLPDDYSTFHPLMFFDFNFLMTIMFKNEITVAWGHFKKHIPSTISSFSFTNLLRHFMFKLQSNFRIFFSWENI